MTKKIKKTIPVQTAFDEWHKDPEYVREYAALADEFALAERFIKTRKAARPWIPLGVGTVGWAALIKLAFERLWGTAQRFWFPSNSRKTR